LLKAKIGIIGGTGLYSIEGITDIEEVEVQTPFGNPSDRIMIGNLGGISIAFLPRHGKGHIFSPTEVPSRANVYALKSLGVERIIAINSAGSLKEGVKPGDLVIPDQIIDRTTRRESTFFNRGVVAHIAFAEPFCPEMSELLFAVAKKIGASVHRGGTFVVIEGPTFSTLAESNLYRSWGTDIIGMTVLPEAKLAREAEMCYASIACVTDYDCWQKQGEKVTVEIILECMNRNISVTKKIIALIVPQLPKGHKCQCTTALAKAIVTNRTQISPIHRKNLKLIIGKYLR
jgi:5'-methylthioadenosine phosphorylase